MKTKVITLYLPQFHQIKENDEWWGKGFTEWTNVKNAKRYSKLQRQPRVPFEKYYYDLSKKEDIKKQVELANEYGIDGFCIYHYYSIGKKLLERPAEIIRDNKDIKINYFFSWANHDWRRVWASSSREMLREQEYGSDREIMNHFKYLLSFFKDKRYIKINNKPVFSIYQNIEKGIFEKIAYIWESEAIKNGFDGIFWIGTLSSKDSQFNYKMNDYFRFEPNYTRTIMPKKAIFYQKLKQKIYSKLNNTFIKSPYSFNYNFICKEIYRTSINEKKAMLGIFSGWDNTPRYKNKGYYYKGESVDIFKKYCKELYKLSIEKENPFFIINAWNEWGEGAYLEPDEEHGFAYLEAIRDIKNEIEGKSHEK